MLSQLVKRDQGGAFDMSALSDLIQRPHVKDEWRCICGHLFQQPVALDRIVAGHPGQHVGKDRIQRFRLCQAAQPAS